jgi:hypothetical protein
MNNVSVSVVSPASAPRARIDGMRRSESNQGHSAVVGDRGVAWRGARGLAGAVAVLAVTAGPAQARCERGDYRIVPSQNKGAEVAMLASSGRDCVIRLAATRRFQVTRRAIVEMPRNGTVSIEGETAYYRSLPGFRGTDRFVAAVSAKGTDGEGTSLITVMVTVD